MILKLFYKMIDLKNKNILIAGATSDIGFDNAIALHIIGTLLVLTGRNSKKLNEIKLKLGDKHQYINIGFHNETDIIKAVQSIKHPINGAVFAIGHAKMIPAQLASLNRIDEVNFINFSIPVLLTKQLLKQKKIITNSSLVYYTSVSYQKQFIGNALYSSAKLALSNYVKSLAIELSLKKIRCNSIAPGFVQTNQNKFVNSDWLEKLQLKYPNGFTTKKQITDALIFLLSENSSGINGQEIIVDGGYSVSL
jgi:NAD(P)-dependent dehydrogenase (short-subunit alcohol dehydrogenase family)